MLRNGDVSRLYHVINGITYNDVACVLSVLVLSTGPGTESNTMDEAIGSTRGLSPKGFMTFQKMLLYQARFCSVRPKRRKNVKAKAGLIHWLNLMPKLDQKPVVFHSSDVIEGMVEKLLCTVFHPGQNPAPPLPS